MSKNLIAKTSPKGGTSDRMPTRLSSQSTQQAGSEDVLAKYVGRTLFNPKHLGQHMALSPAT